MEDEPASWVLWPFKPNWRASYTVSYEFKTEIFVTDDGSEQRRALRSTPRKTLQFTALCHGDGLQRFNRIVDRSQNKTIVMPEVTRAAALAVPLAAGADRLLLAVSAPAWMRNGAQLILADPVRGYLRAAVASTDATSLRLTDAPGPLLPGTLIHPALPGLLTPTLTARRATSRIAEPEVSFKVTPCSESYDFGSALALHEGEEWLQLRPNWAQAMPVEHQWPIGMVDFGRGRVTSFTPINFPTSVRTFDLLVTDATPIINMFGRMRGRRGHFFIGSMEDDMRPAAPLGGTKLLVQGTGIYESYRNDPVRALVEITVAGGARYACRIVGMSVVDGNTELTLAETLPVVPADQVLRVSWLTHARFATDVLEVVYTTTGAAKILLNIQTLPLTAARESVLRVTDASDFRQTLQGAYREAVIR